MIVVILAFGAWRVEGEVSSSSFEDLFFFDWVNGPDCPICKMSRFGSDYDTNESGYIAGRALRRLSNPCLIVTKL